LKVPKVVISEPPRKSLNNRRCSIDLVEKQHNLDQTLRSQLQLSEVMDNLDLGNIDTSPLKQIINNNYDIATVRENKAEL
jgi:hypothetical protein